MARECIELDQVLHVTKRTTQEQNNNLGIKHLQEAQMISTHQWQKFIALANFVAPIFPLGRTILWPLITIQWFNENFLKQTSHSYTYFNNSQKVSSNLDKEIIFEPVK